jgi:hypothetical protein
MTLRHFIELPPFRRYLDQLGNGQRILSGIQETLLKNPNAGVVIQGTGGLRKLRHAAEGRGKSGGFRVTYLYVPENETIYLFVLYAKNEKDSLSAAEKKELKPLVEQLKNARSRS